MSNKYSFMDDWDSKKVAQFKEEAVDKELELFGPDLLSRDASSEYRIPLESKRLVAEGDSWFDYLPGTDIIDCLRKHHGYSIKNYARAGDTLENMIYGAEIDRKFQRVEPTIERVLQRIDKLKPQVFLFSGGGNDIAGEEFESFLNHNNSGLPALRETYINNMINVVFKKYFEDLIHRVTAVSPETNIVVHGYGNTVPTGVGVNVLFFRFAGPWLRPALAKKGIFDPQKQRKAVETMIDAFNDMLSQLDRSHPRFFHVDLRGMIDADNDWVNELHLKNSAFARAADLIHEKIQEL
jgi:hypothetical protein